MITAALLLMAHQDSLPSAGEVISKMIAKYHDAKTVKGNLTTTVELGNQKLVVNSVIQIERPGKMYLRQDVPSQNMSFVVTSDGKEFSYQKPADTPSSDRNPLARLTEDFRSGMGLGDVYRAAGHSLAERSAVLDLLISDMRDLSALRDQWATIDLTGKIEHKGAEVYRIVGTWRLNKQSAVTANFGLYVSPEGDLRKYVIDQLPGVDDKIDGTVTRTIDVDVKVGSDVDPRLFAVIK